MQPLALNQPPTSIPNFVSSQKKSGIQSPSSWPLQNIHSVFCWQKTIQIKNILKPCHVFRELTISICVGWEVFCQQTGLEHYRALSGSV